MSKRRSPARVPRFYGQHIHNNINQEPPVPEGWQIFDRELTNQQGEALPIGWAIDNRHARHIVRALNNLEG